MKVWMDRLTRVQKTFAAVVSLVVGLGAAYAWVEHRTMDRKADAIADEVVARVADEVVLPLLKVWEASRDVDHQRWEVSTRIGIEYMNAADSTLLLISEMMRILNGMDSRLNRLEVLAESDSETTQTQMQLDLIWKELRSDRQKDTLNAKLDEIMRAVRIRNKGRIDVILEGDRAN